jgi:hypothetical protein
MATSSPFVTHYIQPKFTLARLSKEDEIFSLIVTLTKKVAPLVNDPKLPDLVEYIANLVENFVRKGDKIDPNTLIIRIYREIYPTISDTDINHILVVIQHLRDNHLIKRIPIYKKVWYYASNFFLRQFTN